MQNKKGFTLIELLVVVGIIGLLATLAVVAFGSARDKAKDSKRVANVRSIVAAYAAASNDGKVFEAASCGAGSTIVACRICDDTNCSTGDKTKDYINPVGLADPDNATGCVDNPGAVCTAAFSSGGPAPVLGSDPNFTINFYTKADGAIKKGKHTANANGIIE